MLSGLDGVAWEALHHAYGPADDLPAVIRAAASADEQEADEADEALFSSVLHQGTVYPASVAVVPFVAELAVTSAVHHRHLLVYLLGGMADPHDAHNVDIAAVGSALTTQVPRLLPLLADPDPKVREAAAYTLARCPEMAGLVVARLRERWVVEDVALVRASLLAAGGRLDPAGCGRWLSAALDDRQAAVRAAAALAIVGAGVPWPERGTDAVISAFAAGDPLRGWLWIRGDSLAALLKPFDEVGGVPAEVINALVHVPSVETRHKAAYAVYALDKARRSAPARLLPLLAPLLADADAQVRRAAANTVRLAGSAGVLVADELAVLAAGCADDDSDGWAAAAEALRALLQLGDPRWRAPLLAAWRSGRAPYDAGKLLTDAGVAADPELLAAVRERLVRIEGASMTASSERALLVWLLGSWGPAAAPAIPELLVALEHGWGVAPRALVAIGPAAAAALPALRTAASRGELAAAAAVWRLAGEPELLLGTVGRAVDHDQFCAPAIDTLVALGEHARPLLGRLQRLLTGEPARTFPARDAQMAAARVVWRLTADPDAVLPTVRAVLAAGDQPAGTAASLAAELGTHARPLLPLLRRTLNERWASAHAAHALWRLGDNPAELVEPLLVAVADEWGAGSAAALDLLVDMQATRAVPRLRELAEQDARIVTCGIDDEVIGRDEWLQARLWWAIERLEA